MTPIEQKRVTQLNSKKEDPSKSYVLYWMHMTHRTKWNFALKLAIEKANEHGLPLIVYQGLNDDYPHASDRIHTFILEGVKELYKSFDKLGINYGFYLVNGKKKPILRKLVADAALVVSDDFPAFLAPKFNKKVSSKNPVAYYVVDSHTTVPANCLEKEEWAAYTIRTKIHKKLDEVLTPFKMPKLRNKKKIKLPSYFLKPGFDVKKEVSKLDIDHEIKPTRFKGGESEARKLLKKFISKKLTDYDKKRNDPAEDSLSCMSPYLHFGMISPVDIAMQVLQKTNKTPSVVKQKNSVASYLEELIVRRDLAFNFCKFNNNYDNFKGLSDWAKKTLNEHRKDKREHTYTKKQFEEAKTHDEAWNAAQKEMVCTGKMHGYMRMYWCKKILEWTKSPEDAFKIAIYLNDKYELDGRDPNGYAGIAWSIGGKHDRAWPERPIFGKVRYMAQSGLKKKFDVEDYAELVDKQCETK